MLLLMQVSGVRGDHGSVYMQKMERSVKSRPDDVQLLQEKRKGKMEKIIKSIVSA